MAFHKGHTLNKGRVFSAEHREKLRLSHLGKPRVMTPEGRKSMLAKLSGPNSYMWKGGPRNLICQQCKKPFCGERGARAIQKFCSKPCHYAFRNKGKTSPSKKIRQTRQYREWRKAVFARDKYTCQSCGSKSRKKLGMTIYLNADHIKPFALYPEQRFDISNGRTLCLDCHRKTPTFGGRTKMMTGKLDNV